MTEKGAAELLGALRVVAEIDRRIHFGGDADEASRRRSPRLEDSERHPSALRARRLSADADQLLGLVEGQSPEIHAVKQRDHGAAGANAQREREHRGRSEPAIARDQPRRITNVLRQLVDDAKAPLIAVDGFHLFDSAKGLARREPRIVPRHALRDVFIGQQIEMRLHFIGQAPVARAAKNEVEQAREEKSARSIRGEQPVDDRDCLGPVVGFGGEVALADRGN